MTWQDALVYLNRFESNGCGFWSRHGEEVVLWVRGEHGNDPKQWHNARLFENLFGLHVVDGVTPDPQSGHLRLVIGRFKELKGVR